MRIHALKTLKQFWIKYPDSEKALRYWNSKIVGNVFNKPQEITRLFYKSDYIGNERIVFNICKNQYRLVAAFNYEYQLCFIKFIGTHLEYDKINPKYVEF